MCLFISFPFFQYVVLALIVIVQLYIYIFKRFKTYFEIYRHGFFFKLELGEELETGSEKEGHDQEEGIQYYESAMCELDKTGWEQP